MIDYDKLSKLCKIQCTGEECAAFLEMDYDTLNINLERDGHSGFSDYFKKQSAGGKISLRRRQFRSAEDGSVPMLIWLGKQYLGQLDQKPIDSDADKTPAAGSINYTTNPSDADSPPK